MPVRYSRETALPLRVPPELRAAVDALGARLPRGLRLPRNAVAVAALARGLDALGAELGRDPMAIHRQLGGLDGTDAGPLAPVPSTPAAGAGSGASPPPAPPPGPAARPRGAGPSKAPARRRRELPATPAKASKPGASSAAAVLARLLAADPSLRALELEAKINRSRVGAWMRGERSVSEDTVHRIAKYLDKHHPETR